MPTSSNILAYYLFIVWRCTWLPLCANANDAGKISDVSRGSCWAPCWPWKKIITGILFISNPTAFPPALIHGHIFILHSPSMLIQCLLWDLGFGWLGFPHLFQKWELLLQYKEPLVLNCYSDSCQNLLNLLAQLFFPINHSHYPPTYWRTLFIHIRYRSCKSVMDVVNICTYGIQTKV